LPFTHDDKLPLVVWFGAMACTVDWPEEIEVRVGGVLIARFDKRDSGARNVTLAQLAATGEFRYGELATAFNMTAEGLRLLRRAHAEKGLAAMGLRRRGGGASKLPEKLRAKLDASFSRGLKGAAAHAALTAREQRGISKSYVRQLYAAFKRAQPTAEATAEPAEGASEAMSSATTDLPLFSTDEEDIVAATAPPHTSSERASAPAAPCSAAEAGSAEAVAASDAAGDSATPAGYVQPVEAEGWFGPVAPESGFVQHAGSWLLLSMLGQMGLYDAAEERRRAEALELSKDDVRLAIDAFAVSLALGEGSVEGVRRLSTPSGGALLCASGVPSPWWVRKALGQLADSGALLFHLAMAGRHIRAGLAPSPDEPAVYYIDGHLRPYTGKQVLRRGWRMQSRRVVPGTSDYWVHSVDGRPLFRVEVPEHGSLTEQLAPAARLLRMALGDDARILLAFDRGGAFPTAMAGLRDLNFELATYERGAYQQLASNAFTEAVDFGDEVVHYVESRDKNLGKGRGRVRRICARGDDGHQYNILGCGPAAAETFVRAMAGRWCQENAFHHGDSRWHINHLDARGVEHYDPATIVPNPARRKLDHDLRIACIAEGDARRKLAHLDGDDQIRRDNLAKDILAAENEQRDLLDSRSRTPNKAPLAQTELAGKLVHHKPGYKLTLDTVRVACHNAEADLAAILAEELTRPREAKKLLAAIFAAPANVLANGASLRVQILPAASTDELHAIDHLCHQINRRQLRLPGDPRGRRLVFGSQDS